jgi:hypothetical protein
MLEALGSNPIEDIACFRDKVCSTVTLTLLLVLSVTSGILNTVVSVTSGILNTGVSVTSGILNTVVSVTI